ncbi:hypothetical protein NDK50_22310 [Paraburkholderia bryophila]|nr:hypothetical protein [Paraburkholderia bryophila]WCM23601.1 hypothetical protein NDK50_22310 [Paraburkholderia bryophila]
MLVEASSKCPPAVLVLSESGHSDGGDAVACGAQGRDKLISILFRHADVRDDNVNRVLREQLASFHGRRSAMHRDLFVFQNHGERFERSRIIVNQQHGHAND